MAKKIKYSKLKLKAKSEVVDVPFKDLVITVQQYLPIETKFELIQEAVNMALGDKFRDTTKESVTISVLLIKYYTNIDIPVETDTILETYDEIVTSGLLSVIRDNIPVVELDYVTKMFKETLESYYNYYNSVLGIIDTLNNKYADLGADVDTITEKLSDNKNLGLLKEVLTKLN